MTADRSIRNPYVHWSTHDFDTSSEPTEAFSAACVEWDAMIKRHHAQRGETIVEFDARRARALVRDRTGAWCVRSYPCATIDQIFGDDERAARRAYRLPPGRLTAWVPS